MVQEKGSRVRWKSWTVLHAERTVRYLLDFLFRKVMLKH